MIYTGFLLGLLGSTHCLGMCAPIAASLPAAAHRRMLPGRLAYNLGRTVTYALMGAIAGAAGQSLSLVGVEAQRYLTVSLGATLVLAAAFSLNPEQWFGKARWFSALLVWLKTQIGRFLRQKSLSGQFGVGLVNGLLPCGLVYMGLFGAAATGTLWGGAAFMSLFGLGTVPLMLAAGMSGALLKPLWRERVRKFYPVALALVGLLLIWRADQLSVAPSDNASVPQVICH